MGGDQAQMLQANALLQLLQENCWWSHSSSAAITMGLECRQGNPLQWVKLWNHWIILHWLGERGSGMLRAVGGP